MGNECVAECKIGADRDEDGTMDVWCTGIECRVRSYRCKGVRIGIELVSDVVKRNWNMCYGKMMMTGSRKACHMRCKV